MNILIAHSNISYLEATKQLLRVHGPDFKVDSATSIQSCIQRFQQNHIDIFLIDSVLLRDDPKSFLELLRPIANARTVIILLEESEYQLADELRRENIYELVYKRKGYLSALPQAIRELYKKTSESESAAASPLPPQESAAARSGIAVSEGYFVCDRKGRFLSANKTLQKIAGYSEDEILELSLADMLGKDDEREFFNHLFSMPGDREIPSISLSIIDKVGERHPVDLKIRVLHDESAEKNIIGFRGSLTVLAPAQPQSPARREEIDQPLMINYLLDIVQMSYTEPLNVLLKRIAEVVCQVFGFKRSTVALLDRLKKAYIKHAMIGYSNQESHSSATHTREVPQDIIQRIFTDREKIKIIYHDQPVRDTQMLLDSGSSSRSHALTRPENVWHKRDLVLLRLADHRNNQFGYISLDEPLDDLAPNQATFQNLEMFSQLLSMAIENYYRFSSIDRKNRRLKQVLMTSNIFKLYLSLNELLKEMVWSVKFSLEFNLVSLVLISKKSGQLETKAVACDDKIKLLQISELSYDLKEFSNLLRDEYQRGKSYLITSEEPALKHLKQVYYGRTSNGHYVDGWPYWALLLLPIKSREGKIIGFLMADDPADARMPSAETINIIEILANQVAIAIDNRMLYVQAKEQINTESVAEAPPEQEEDNDDDKPDDEGSSGLRRLVDRFLR
ncbi:PAS domain S-box protein [candidate division KSB1 bacterium]|nr:PAS domain S-box protein [candidate division KSB1 bacterium]